MPGRRPGVKHAPSLPAQDRVLVTEDQDLYIFGRAGLGEEGEPAGDAAEHEVDQAQRHTS
jgi:hypothetical protein